MTRRPRRLARLAAGLTALLSVPVVALIAAGSPSAAASGLVAAQSAGAATGVPAARPTSDRRARHLLARMVSAQSQVAYMGTQFVSTWSTGGTTSQLVQVRHVPGTGTGVRVLGTAARPDGAAYTTTADDMSSDRQQAERLLDTYDLAVAGSEAVAGRAATVLEAHAPGHSAVPAARFWIDDTSGVLLRREIYDGSGATWRASSFVDISIGTLAGAASLLPPALPQPWAALDAEALQEWREYADCPDRLPDGMALVEARRSPQTESATDTSTPTTQPARSETVHLHYTDGLGSVSLFVQRGVLDRKALRGYSRERWSGATVYVASGTPRQVTWTAGDNVYTVLADAPDDSVAAVVAALPHDPAENVDGVDDRMRRGASRVASWMNPFG